MKRYWFKLGCSHEDGSPIVTRYFVVNAENRFWALYTAVRWALSGPRGFKNVTSIKEQW